MFTLSVGKTDLYICDDCKGEMVTSVQIVGFPEMEVIA
nr:MAG TPA: zinc finger protein [Caudoviricetes sp.]